MTEPDDLDLIDDEPDEDADMTESDREAALARWWAQLPDFIKADYPLDLPPARMPFAQFVFTQAGAPRLCPQAACRRGETCRGGDGPPCYRADRKQLADVLFLWWMRLFEDLSEEDYEATLRRKGSPYAATEAEADIPPKRARPKTARPVRAARQRVRR